MAPGGPRTSRNLRLTVTVSGWTAGFPQKNTSALTHILPLLPTTTTNHQPPTELTTFLSSLLRQPFNSSPFCKNLFPVLHCTTFDRATPSALILPLPQSFFAEFEPLFSPTDPASQPNPSTAIAQVPTTMASEIPKGRSQVTAP